MSPPRYIMCQKLSRTAAAEKEEAAAAAAILVEMMKTGAVATAKDPWTTMPDKMRALCSAANLVYSSLLYVLSEGKAKGGYRQEDDLVSPPESVGVAPQPDVDVAAPVVVENATESTSDVPACYAYRHSCWRRRKVPAVVVAAAGGDDDDAAPVSEAPVLRVRIVVNSADVGVLEASLEVGDDRPSLVDVDDSSSSSTAPIAVAVLPDASEVDRGDLNLSAQEIGDAVQPRLVETVREDWPDRQRRRGRGGRYAAFMAALLSRRGGGGRRRRP